MNRSADSPTVQLAQALRNGCGTVARANHHRILFDGRRGSDGMCGVVEINENSAFCQKRYVAHGFVKKHAKAGELLETGDNRDAWSPSRYQDVSFRNVEEGRR